MMNPERADFWIKEVPPKNMSLVERLAILERKINIEWLKIQIKILKNDKNPPPRTV